MDTVGRIPPETIESIVRSHRPVGGPISASPIPTGKFNTSFFVTVGDEDLVLRIAPHRDAVFLFYERDMMRQEPEIHHRMRAETRVPVARIHAFDASFTTIDRAYLLMERLSGRPWTDAPNVDAEDVLRQVGRHLAATHRLTADAYGYLGSHRPMPPQGTWVEAFEMMWNRLIDDVVSVGHYSDEESGSLRALLDRHLALFDRPVPSSLLHMDVWHQNILVDEAGDVTGLVDWDRALWGDAEIEFAVLDYCGISQPAFWEGYGWERDLSPEARVRQAFYLLYELQKYIVIRQGRNEDAAGARRYKEQAMGLVRQCFPA